MTLCLLTVRAAASSCQYGEEAGTWRKVKWDVVRGRGKELHYFRLDDSLESVWFDTAVEPPGLNFGSAWQTLSTSCQLQNLLFQYLQRAEPVGKNTTLVFIGDSNDAHLLDFVCQAYHVRHGYSHWRAYVHSHRTVNYCVLDSGLALVQMYSMSTSAEVQARVVSTVRDFLHGNDSATYTQFDGAPGTNRTLIGRADEVAAFLAGRAPDVVVVSNTYWALNAFVARDANASLVNEGYLGEYMQAMRGLIHMVREVFASTPIVLRTSHQVRSDCEDGDTTRRVWGKKAWVAQINAAKRAVARLEQRAGDDVQLLDVELMASMFTPAQSTLDDIHYRSWLGLEIVNVLLNIISGSEH